MTNDFKNDLNLLPFCSKYITTVNVLYFYNANSFVPSREPTPMQLDGLARPAVIGYVTYKLECTELETLVQWSRSEPDSTWSAVRHFKPLGHWKCQRDEFVDFKPNYQFEMFLQECKMYRFLMDLKVVTKFSSTILATLSPSGVDLYQWVWYSKNSWTFPSELLAEAKLTSALTCYCHTFEWLVLCTQLLNRDGIWKGKFFESGLRYSIVLFTKVLLSVLRRFILLYSFLSVIQISNCIRIIFLIQAYRSEPFS